MGFKVNKNIPPMERELNYFLHDLCVNWGFCIPSEDWERISKSEFLTANEFAIEILKAEKMEDHSEWENNIIDRFKERFGSDFIDSKNFADRIRGVKENW